MFLEFEDEKSVRSAIQGNWMINGRALSVSVGEFIIFFK